ncbi:uncharacterized protein LOC126314419 [Schistocerca gregaria]|uniref:uncharacterized protein LOC126314419 n=1 Tax=Schistocerca gregaria TaxID=7010 RepID=UPI00211DC678|nr:uncharacterized protein LOC126314419 [Schistocerca gregaria]
MLLRPIGRAILWPRAVIKNADKSLKRHSYRRYCATKGIFDHLKLSEEEEKRLHNLVAIINNDEKKKFYTRFVLKLYEQRCAAELLTECLLNPLKGIEIPPENTLDRNVFIAFTWGVVMQQVDEVRTAIIFYQHALQTDEKLVEAYKVLKNGRNDENRSEFDQAAKVVKDSIQNIQTLPIGKSMIMLLISENCLNDIKSGRVLGIYKSFEKIQQNIVEAEITTPYELNEHEKKMYKNIIANMFKDDVNLKISTRIDPLLEGGYVLNVGGKVIDNSWKRQREKYFEQLEAMVPFAR